MRVSEWSRWGGKAFILDFHHAYLPAPGIRIASRTEDFVPGTPGASGGPSRATVRVKCLSLSSPAGHCLWVKTGRNR